MATSWFSCKPCSASDPTQDTVKVDPSLLNKENVQPLQLAKPNVEKQRQLEAQEEAAKRRKEEAVAAAAQAARLGAERAAAERARREEATRREAEEVARHESERVAAEQAEKAAAERALADEAAKAAAADAAAAVQEAWKCQKAEKEQARLARKEAEEKANAWCKTNGFQNINSQKKTLRGATKFPLHTAVKYSNQDMIGVMLIAGAKTDVKDSNNQTPIQLAEKLNKNGSHTQILAMLR